MSGRTVQHRLDGDIDEHAMAVQAELDLLGLRRLVGLQRAAQAPCAVPAADRDARG